VKELKDFSPQVSPPLPCLTWNPVKELKDKLINRKIAISPCMWNPVKELKDYDIYNPRTKLELL